MKHSALNNCWDDINKPVKYFDELPIELQNVVKDWLIDNFDSNDRPEAFECKRRDGFIPHSWNKGGLGIYAYRSLSDFRFGDNPIDLDSKVQTKVTESIKYTEELATEDWKEQNKTKLVNIPDYSINYHDLEKLGKSALANSLDEAINEYFIDDSSSTYHEIRVMFDGDKTFTVDVMFKFSDAPYHRSCDQCKEWTIKTFGVKTLEKFLKKITKEVQLYFPN